MSIRAAVSAPPTVPPRWWGTKLSRPDAPEPSRKVTLSGPNAEYFADILRQGGFEPDVHPAAPSVEFLNRMRQEASRILERVINEMVPPAAPPQEPKP
jgi:hypothetical protein